MIVISSASGNVKTTFSIAIYKNKEVLQQNVIQREENDSFSFRKPIKDCNSFNHLNLFKGESIIWDGEMHYRIMYAKDALSNIYHKLPIFVKKAILEYHKTFNKNQ